MSKMTLLLITLAISLFQLFWLIKVWRRDGFFASLKLFFYGVLSAAAYALQDFIESL